MNLVLLGWAPSGAIDADRAEASFAGLLRELPFHSLGPTKEWGAPSGRLVAFCAGHGSGQTGGTTYAHFEADRLAMYSGRPFVWTAEFAADGRQTLDPRFYLQPPEAWIEALDGRCLVARYDDRTATLDLYTDHLGASHLYTATDGRTQWFSNNAELLRRLLKSRTTAPLALASLVGCGWSLGGQPFWQEVRRLPRGGCSFRPEGETHRDLHPKGAPEALFEGGFVAEAAARTLVAVIQALADWPGRPSVVSLTGGRDSRLVFAAALQAGLDFEARIIVGEGGSDTPDARTARSLCAIEGRQLEVARSRHVATVAEAGRALRLCAPGTLSLDLAWSALNRPSGSGVPDAAPDRPLTIVHSGHGGELARAYYGLGDQDPALVARGLYRHITHRWPRPPLTKEGGQLVEAYVTRWVREQVGVGVAPAHLPDLFYLDERMNSWVGGSHGFDEYMADLTSPLWTPRLLPHQFGLPAADRARELFHFHVLNALDSELARAPFAGSNPSWPTFDGTRTTRSRHVQRARRLAGRAGRELRRRYRYRVGNGPSPGSQTGLAEAAALAREAAPERSHEAWDVIDRKRALRVLARDPAALDARSQRTVWRLATALLVCRE
jgi:hypothetical protein